ncbi:MAG TPA: pyruvate kinase [Myxococcota bacterium]|nr:pyruvate kinase [Myxococcota bacterium]MDP7300596.1 pyruvate kinase [Myxococcota bacterium]HJO22734.1 pyruvate kinase [Myxococcota bacterium]
MLATAGPASAAEETLEKLVDAGVTIFRLNFSHGDNTTHAETLEKIRSVSERMGQPVGVLGDLPGPKIRLSEVPGEGIELTEGERVEVGRGPELASPADRKKPARFGSSWAGLVDCVEPGQRVLIDDGLVRLRATAHRDDTLICEVTAGGRVSSRKGVNLPDSDLSIELPTDQDRRFATWAIEHELDWIAMSFVRSADDVQALDAHLRKVSGQDKRPIPIVAKIEVPRAVDHASEIVSEVDALMVARGDLGVEIDIAMVPSIQKHLVAVARDAGIPCIVATQMLQSMIEAPTPTRAEASDVATAIFDGADGVMLSGETAVGRYPIEAVTMMARINRTTETAMRRMNVTSGKDLRASRTASFGPQGALVRAIWTAARSVDARCVVIPSSTGQYARLISRNDFLLPVLALASDPQIIRRMLLYRGVTPVQSDQIPEHEALVERAEQEVLTRGWAKAGEYVLIVAREFWCRDDAGAHILVRRVRPG